MELVPGVHLVEGTRGGNVYLLVEDDGLALVDAARSMIVTRTNRPNARIVTGHHPNGRMLKARANPDKVRAMTQAYL